MMIHGAQLAFKLQPTEYFCHYCGKLFPYYKDEWGKEKHVCGECKDKVYNHHYPIFKTNNGLGYCIYCRAEIPLLTYYCGKCPGGHKQRIKTVVKRGKGLNVLYECPHNKRKVNHHFDYMKPLDVYKLCHSCHSKTHNIYSVRDPRKDWRNFWSKCVKSGKNVTG